MKIKPEIAREILLDIEELHKHSTAFLSSNSNKFNRAKQYDLETITFYCKKLSKTDFLTHKSIYYSNKLYYATIYVLYMMVINL